MSNFFTDNDDLRFYVDHAIDWETVVRLVEHDFRAPDAPKDAAEAVELYRDILNMVGEFAAEEIAPRAAEVDRKDVAFVDGEVKFPKALQEIFDQIKARDLNRLVTPRELGGSGVPLIVYQLCSEMVGRADVSVMSHYGFYTGVALAMLFYSAREGSTTFDAEKMQISGTRFAKEIAEIVSGQAWGAMDITEPDAGSDMAALRTVGEQDADGRWTVSGEKIFISSGHGKYHFVIARTEKAANPNDPFAGLAGLSLFLVKAYEDLPDGTRKRYVKIDRVEEKLGHHGSVTAALTFDRSPAELVGKRGEGFNGMLMLMNYARLAVGFEGIGLCEAAYRLAKNYASERKSMGKTVDRHEMIADYLDEMRTDIQGLRALAVYGAVHEEIADRYELRARLWPDYDDLERKRVHKEAKQHRARSRRVTPLLKYLAAEKAVEMARRAIQIHGGNGYMKEFGAEKLLRDALVLPIYEGTSQIQALMAMKDTLGVILKNPQEFLRKRAQVAWAARSSRDELERRVAKLQNVSMQAQWHLLTRTAKEKLKQLPITDWPAVLRKDWDPKRDFAFAMLHAERLTRILADEAIAKVLWHQAKRWPERREVLARYLERAELRAQALLNEITTTGDRLLRTLQPSEADRASGG